MISCSLQEASTSSQRFDSAVSKEDFVSLQNQSGAMDEDGILVRIFSIRARFMNCSSARIRVD